MKIKLLNGKGIVPGYLLIVLITLCSLASAQQPPDIITGTVFDAGGPIPGVSVLVKGTNFATVTKEDGTYAISASESDILVFTYSGYEPVEAMVGDQAVINIEMYEAVALEEAVINAGYYTVKDKERTGSISRVTAKEIENQPVGNVLSAIQGRMAGVQITQHSGVPGGGFEVLIRGKNSIAAGNEPLYIIDGVPFGMQSMGELVISGTVLPNSNISPLNFLDPSSIESIEVLKDADATAIYGSRGANGVILITTKKGKNRKAMIKLNFTSGFYQATKMMKLLSTEQYVAMREEAFLNDGIESIPSFDYDINGTWNKDRYTDWQKEFIGNIAYFNTAILSATGGTERTSYLLGGNFSKETMVFPGNYNYKKSSFYSTIRHGTKNDRLSFHFSGIYGIDNNFLPPIDLTYSARTLAPNAPELYDENGELNWENSTWSNPLAPLQGNYRNYTKNLIGNAGIDYKLWDHTTFKGNFGYTESDLREVKLTPHTIYNPAYGFTSDWSKQQNNESHRSSWIIEPQIDGNYTLWNQKLNILLGATFQEIKTSSLSVLGEGYSNNVFINCKSSSKSGQ